MNKNLFELSWKVTESDYRALDALSYSLLAKYEREGYNSLETLFDRVESPSLAFGSAVDSIITGGMQEFKERFLVAEFPLVSPSIKYLLQELFRKYGSTHRSLNSIKSEDIIETTIQECYQLNWQPNTRVKVLLEKGSEYYNLLALAQDKTILNTEEYKDIENTVLALKQSKATEFHFKNNNPFDNTIERFYQLKFKATFNSIDYKCMADLIIVDHKQHIVYPYDLKTSYHPEYEFYESFLTWRYDIQARLYWKIIRQTMDKDPYFKDFKLANYVFIVVNKYKLNPLLWEFKNTTSEDTLKFTTNSGKVELRFPTVIGEELYHYLHTPNTVPKGIHIEEVNCLEQWIIKN